MSNLEFAAGPQLADWSEVYVVHFLRSSGGNLSCADDAAVLELLEELLAGPGGTGVGFAFSGGAGLRVGAVDLWGPGAARVANAFLGLRKWPVDGTMRPTAELFGSLTRRCEPPATKRRSER